MAIGEDIDRERAKLIKVTFGNKLAKKVTQDVLFPILDNLEKQYPLILETVGQWLSMRIAQYMMEYEGTGRTYQIYEYNFDAAKGQKKTHLATYTAGGDFGPPVSFDAGGGSLIPPTGSLLEAIRYEVDASGSLNVGLLNPNFSTGREFKSLGYYPSSMNETDDDIILVSSDASSQPVGHYWRELITNERYNWFHHMMIELRKEYREKLRTEARKTLNKITKRISVRRAIVFKVYFK